MTKASLKKSAAGAENLDQPIIRCVIPADAPGAPDTMEKCVAPASRHPKALAPVRTAMLCSIRKARDLIDLGLFAANADVCWREADMASALTKGTASSGSLGARKSMRKPDLIIQHALSWMRLQ
jgi:hypothetical protein